MPQLKSNLRVYIGVPWLRDDHFQKYFKKLETHIDSQETDVPFTTPYKTPVVGGKTNLESGTQSLLNAICDRMNAVIDMFMRSKCSHLWMLDADVEPPPHALDTLLRHDVDLASGVYPFHNFKDCHAMMGGRMPEDNPCGFFIPRDWNYMKGKVMGVEEKVSAGTGCLLVKRRVFKRWNPRLNPIRFNRSNGQRVCGADVWFWKRCQDAGFTARLDANVVCGHQPEYPLSKVDEWLK